MRMKSQNTSHSAGFFRYAAGVPVVGVKVRPQPRQRWRRPPRYRPQPTTRPLRHRGHAGRGACDARGGRGGHGGCGVHVARGGHGGCGMHVARGRHSGGGPCGSRWSEGPGPGRSSGDVVRMNHDVVRVGLQEWRFRPIAWLDGTGRGDLQFLPTAQYGLPGPRHSPSGPGCARVGQGSSVRVAARPESGASLRA